MTITRHGHHIPGTRAEIGHVPVVVQCGGIDICLACTREAEHIMQVIRTATQPAPVKPDKTRHDDRTLVKVRDALKTVGITESLAYEAIRAMQNAGILFSEYT